MSTLNIGEIAFLRKVHKGNQLLKGTVSAQMQTLIDRGYIQLFSERIGPLNTPTGEVVVATTELGDMLLDDLDNQ